MKHTLHLSFGNYSSEVFEKVFRSFSKSVDGHLPYFHPYLWINQEKESVKIESFFVPQADEDVFVPGVDNQAIVEHITEVEFSREKYESVFNDWFEKTYSKYVNISNGASELFVSLYVPLWDPYVVNDATAVVRNLEKFNQNYNVCVDIFGFSHDVADIFLEELPSEKLAEAKPQLKVNTAQAIKTIDGECKKCSQCRNFYVLQNKQIKNVALNLSENLLIRLIEEFAMLYIEHNIEVFGSNMGYNLKGFGLVVLDFDKYSYAERILSKSYLYVMDREGVNDRDADVNQLGLAVNKKMLFRKDEKEVNLFSRFWEEFVSPKLAAKQTEESIISEMSKEAKEYIQSISNQFQDFLNDDYFTLLEKRAGLASIIGEDDELFEGMQFDRHLPILDDCEFEPANVFVEYHNDIVDNVAAIEELSETDAALSENAYDSEGHVKIPLEEIKKLKLEIKTSTQALRKLNVQCQQALNSLSETDQADKVEVRDGFFVFRGSEYKIIPNPPEEHPFDLLYEPKLNSLPSCVNLIDGMTPIRDQGRIGSCTAHSALAAYEFLAKTAGKELNLSEMFLYFKSREADGREKIDEGSTIHRAITTLIETGCCEESEWNSSDAFEAPTEKACSAAEQFKVLQGMSVKHNLEHYKDALACGYPVCIVFKIYPSFANCGQTGGIVLPPSDEEIQAGDFGYHAMTLCGYSDAEKVFIVRNSWGTNFGDKGYCYLPYSYVESDKHCANSSFIITKISVGNENRVHVDSSKAVNFETTDSKIRYAIARIKADEEQVKLNAMVEKYETYRINYIGLMTNILNNSVKNILQEGKKLCLEHRIKKYKQEKSDAETKMSEQLSLFDKTTVCGYIVNGVTTVLLSSLWITSFVREWWNFLIKGFGWSAIIALIVLIVYFLYRKDKRRRLLEDLEDEIESAGNKLAAEEKKLRQLSLVTQVAAVLHDNLYRLRETFTSNLRVLRSYTYNLIEWYKAETERVNVLSSQSEMPIISIIDDAAVDIFFENHKEEITKGVRLKDFVKHYKLEETAISRFKNILKKRVIENIFKTCSDFSMFDYITGVREYDYLPPVQKKLNSVTRSEGSTTDALVLAMDRMSEVFVQVTTKSIHERAASKHIIVNQGNEGQSVFDDIVARNFSGQRPMVHPLVTKTRALMCQTINLSVDDLRILNQ